MWSERVRSLGAFVVVVGVVAVVALAAAARDLSVETALALLTGDRSAKVRAQSALSLRAAGEEQDVRDALKAALGDGDAIVRAAAANALGAVPHTDAWEVLTRAATDRDGMVAKWTGWALRRTLAVAPRVVVAGVKTQMAAPGRPASLVRTFEGALLGVLLKAGGRFEITGAEKEMDFSSEGEPTPEAGSDSADDRKMLALMQQGRFDAAALAAAEAPGLDETPVSLQLSAEVEARDVATGAVAKVRLRAATLSGTLACEITAEGVGRPPVIPAGERDEYTMAPKPEDLRHEAVDAAGVLAAKALVAQLAAAEEAPGAQNGRAAR